jgi:hypothetical protein
MREARHRLALRAGVEVDVRFGSDPGEHARPFSDSLHGHMLRGRARGAIGHWSEDPAPLFDTGSERGRPG